MKANIEALTQTTGHNAAAAVRAQSKARKAAQAGDLNASRVHVAAAYEHRDDAVAAVYLATAYNADAESIAPIRQHARKAIIAAARADLHAREVAL